jgi:hypothetical protein
MIINAANKAAAAEHPIFLVMEADLYAGSIKLFMWISSPWRTAVIEVEESAVLH